MSPKYRPDLGEVPDHDGEDFNPFAAPPAAAAPSPGAPGAEEESDAIPKGANVLRVTSIEKVLECGHRESMYASGAWVEPAYPERVRGRAVHAAREKALREFLRTREFPPIESIEQAAIEKVDKDLTGGGAAEDLMSDDDLAALTAERDAIVDEAVTFVRGDLALVLPLMAPHVIAVERRLHVELSGEGIDPGTWFLSGTPDSIGRDPTTGKLVVPDLKTGAKAATQAALNASSQLSGYAFLAQAHYGEIPILAHHSLRILKRLPTTRGPHLSVATVFRPNGEKAVAVAERRATERSPEDLRAFVARLNVVVTAKREGIALPATASSFMSPCHRCPHRGAAVPSSRCGYVAAFRGGEESEAHDE